MVKKEKIYFLLPNLGGGGAERIITSLSFYLKNYEINYVLFENIIEYPYRGKIHVLDIKSEKKLHFFGKLKKLIAAIRKVRAFKKEHQVKSMMSFMTLANFLNILTKKQEKAIISVRNNPTREFEDLGKYKYPYKYFLKLLYRRSDSIIVISKSIKYDLVENFSINKSKVDVIYNPLNTKKINALLHESIDEYIKPLFQHPVLINVGRLSQQKGQWHLIRVFAQLKKRMPNIKLALVGKGPLKKVLIFQCEKLGLKVNVLSDKYNKNSLAECDVCFLGFQKNPYKYLNHSAIFVFSSLFEGFGNVITEAMACGLPVISADCNSGPREILSPESDFKVKTDEPEISKFGILMPSFKNSDITVTHGFKKIDSIWVETIANLLNDSKAYKQYQEAGYKRINDFSMEKIAPLYESQF